MDTSSATRRGRNERVYGRAWARSDPTSLGLVESTALFSLSSDGGGGEGRGEESRFYWISPLPNPLPARSSRGEGGDEAPPAPRAAVGPRGRAARGQNQICPSAIRARRSSFQCRHWQRRRQSAPARRR